MNFNEYEKIKEMNYKEYCEYLQNKYGLAKGPYYSPKWKQNRNISRTKEGLVIHHKYEDEGIKLSDLEHVKNNPYEYQLPEALVYCDYLEHLLLHILICEECSWKEDDFNYAGFGGIVSFIVPELNDVYSGWETRQEWRLNCHKRIIDDKSTYLLLLKRFKDNCSDIIFYTDGCLYKSYNEQYGLWSNENNLKLYKEIKKL